MTNTKSTKRAFLSSVLALVVCIAMLVGSTFAWFTDSASTSGNTIVSGNLDVALEKNIGTETEPNWVSAEGETLKWVTTDSVENVLWEPGCTYQLPKLRIKNNGNLALKYKVIITGITGDAELLEVIKFTGLPQGQEEYVSLLPGNSNEFLIEGHMDEEAGNKYMNKTIDNISITVYATQLNYENDSYGPDYDKNAPMAWSGKTNTDWYLANPTAAEFELSTAEELAGLAAIVNGTAEGIAQDTFSGQTIKLTSDIDLANRSWDTIGRNHDVDGNDPFSGTFDGQNYTVYNLNIYIEDNQRDSVGFIGSAKNATIKNLTIKNVDINADYFVGAVVGKLTSGKIYDCHVKGDINIVSRRNYAAGIVSDGYYSMENCSVIAEGVGNITSAAVAGGLYGRINEGAHSIKNCTVKNLNVQSSQQIAAIGGFVHYGNTISGCNVENVNLTLTATDEISPAIGLASGLWYYKDGSPVTISDNTFRNITISAANAVTGTANILYGCEWNGNTTSVVENNNILENITNNLIYK